MFDKDRVKMIKEMYTPGTRIMLDNMPNDPCPIESGTCGTVRGVDDAGYLLMAWDNGRSLSLIPLVDQFHVIGQSEEPGEEISESEGQNMSM